MNLNRFVPLMLSVGTFASSAFAGHEVAPSNKNVIPAEEPRTWFPDEPKGAVTVGGLFSEHASGVFFDSITGLWAPRTQDAFLFLNSRYHYEDNGQFIASTGLGFRKLFADREIIIGANTYWDSMHSAADNDYGQLGLGVEVLTHWVDARFNYYLPDDERYEVSRSSHTHRSGGREITKFSKTFEYALEGFNAEVGFLIPGVSNYAEVRVFGGYYHYENPFGSDFEGFKARLEARLLPGVIADVEYWDDAALMGGHWTAGARVSVPFSLYNLIHGRNPFEGTVDAFRPRQREFKERMGEMVERSHRIQAQGSGPTSSGSSSHSLPKKKDPVVVVVAPTQMP